MESIKNMNKLTLKHMKVTYNQEKDALVYDRKLMDGPGNSNYGLEVCRSLNMPIDFLENAYKIRKQIDPESKSILDQKTTKYSPNKIKGNCELCDSKGMDIHHMQPQKDANNDGFINDFHKNHRANLMNICKKCHATMTKNNTKMKRTKTTRGYSLQEIN